MQNKENKSNIINTAILFLVFILFTVTVKFFDVASIGPEGSEVGFAKLNGAVHAAIGVNMIWYDITKVLGIIALFTVAFFALLALVELIKGKSFKAVDSDLYALAITYVGIGAAYVLFEKLVINYRPIIADEAEGLEASYPSTHSMLIVALLGVTIFQVIKRISDVTLRRILCFVLGLMIAITVIGRLLSGVHWTTDIIGGMVLGAAFISLYVTLDTAFAPKKN